jgi:hypothetical protein
MKPAVVLLGVLAACSGPVAPVPESRAPQLVQCEPTPASVATCECEDPAEKRCEPRLEEREPSVKVPGAPGFWCATFRKTPDSAKHLGACYRARATCERLRKEGITTGFDVSACEARDSAYCFTLADTVEHAMYWRCYDSDERCAIEHEKYRGKHPKKQFSACELTTRAPSSRAIRRTAIR